MLSRTADHLYWMARYTERAENTARMLDVNIQTQLLPQSAEAAEQGWRAVLGISELQLDFDAKYGLLTGKDVLDFMVRDPGNPSSIASCLTSARENARAVRGTLTTEVWETQNTTWLEMNNLLKDGVLDRDPSEFFEWVKHRSHLSRGVTIGTMLKDEAFYFIRLGTFLERADNTARLLDVKFHGADRDLLAATDMDYYHWAAVLRSVSAFETYRKAYRDVITPERVAELLILRGDTILAERYQYGRHASHRFLSNSMAKTITSMAVGLALREGRIQSAERAVPTPPMLTTTNLLSA